MINFDVTKEEAQLISAIVRRAGETRPGQSGNFDALAMDMDITACHANGCPLKLAELLAADDFNFKHDVFGIRSYIDRSTGKLTDCFLPRYSETRRAR